MFSQPLLRKKMSESDGLFRRFSQDCLFEGLNIVYVVCVVIHISPSHSYTHTHKIQITSRGIHATSTTICSHCQGLYETIPETYVVFECGEYYYFSLKNHSSITGTEMQDKFRKALTLFTRVCHTCEKKTSQAKVLQVEERFSGILNLASTKSRL